MKTEQIFNDTIYCKQFENFYINISFQPLHSHPEFSKVSGGAKRSFHFFAAQKKRA